MSTLPKHLADQVQQYAEDNTETLEFEHGFKAGAAYLFSLDKILFQKVLDYFNLDTTNVPMELYKEVFQLLNPTSEQTAGSQELPGEFNKEGIDIMNHQYKQEEAAFNAGREYFGHPFDRYRFETFEDYLESFGQEVAPSQPSLTEQPVVEDDAKMEGRIDWGQPPLTDKPVVEGAFIPELDAIHKGIDFVATLKTESEAYKAGAGYGYSQGYLKGKEAAAPQPPVSDAVEFGKFVTDNDWVYIPSKDIWLNEEEEENITPKTSEQIYQLFKQSKQ